MIPKMKMNKVQTIIEFIIPGIATSSALIDIFSPWFLEINLSGRKIFRRRKTLIAFKFVPETVYDNS